MNDFSISVHDLTVSYDIKPVLWDLDLELPNASLIGIVGPNGAGKSTFIKTIAGLLKPIAGGVDFSLKNPKIAYVPQSESVDWDFPSDVLDVVTMGTYSSLGWFKRPRKKEKEISMEALKQVGMDAFYKRPIGALSGGQKQRVFLARALVQKADIYLLDEPFKGVDAFTEKSIISILKELVKDQKTVIVVHHDLQSVEEYFDFLVMIHLKLIASGKTKDIFTKENIEKTYRLLA